MTKKSISLQIKLIGILLFLTLGLIGAADYILFKARLITKNREIILKVQSFPTQENTKLDVIQYISSINNELSNLHAEIQALEKRSKIFFIGSIVFVILGVSGTWLFLSRGTLPLKETLEKIAHFQNEPEFRNGVDYASVHLEFEKFFQTAKSILGEAYSINVELKKKILPMTNLVAFSDENMSQFFTDVQEISRSSNYIANTLESTTASIEQVSTSAQTIAERSQQAAQDSAETAKIATEGRKAVAATIETMESIKDEVLGLEDVIADLNSASKQIGEIVNTITNIVHQTNLLALNAAIEAARAGEHGQGFTVVAEEVRKLAEESGEAAEDIGKKIQGMLQKTGTAVQSIQKGTEKVIEGVNVANVAGNNLTSIVSAVTNVNKMIQEISKASSEQSANIESLRLSVESISGATKITSEGTKRVATAVNEQLNYIRQYIATTKELMEIVQLALDMFEKFNFR